MVLNEKTLRRIIGEYRGDDLAGYLAAQIALSQSIVAHLDKIAAERQKAHEAFLALDRDLARQRQKLQERCSHWQSTHYSGTAESESFTQCDICGAYL